MLTLLSPATSSLLDCILTLCAPADSVLADRFLGSYSTPPVVLASGCGLAAYAVAWAASSRRTPTISSQAPVTMKMKDAIMPTPTT